MRTVITQEDLEKAQAHLVGGMSGPDICETCVLAQVLIRLGVSFKSIYCGEIAVGLTDCRELSGVARELSRSPIRNWPSFVGKEIELPDLCPSPKPTT